MFDRNTWASLALILAFVAFPALAADTEAEPHQPVGSAAMPGCMMPEAEDRMPVMRMMMGQSAMPMMAKHIEGRLAFLKTELKITDAQLSLWNAFAQTMRDDASTMQAMPHPMMGMNHGATLPDKLAARETMLAARLEAVRKLKAAADPLYAALTADQKKTADEIMLSPMGMMM
jgi:LTXXQ motif family protein